MNHRTLFHPELADLAAMRPAGYMDELMQCAVSRDADGVTFDTEHPKWLELKERHKNDRQHRVRRNVPLETILAKPPAPAKDADKWGPPLWAKIHTFALTPEAKEPGKLLAFMNDVRRELPGGCSCRGALRKYLRDVPPDESDPFAWSVGLHNVVSRKLGKPQMDLADARRVHSAPAS